MAGADADPLIHEYDAAHSGIRQASAAEIFEAAARISLRGRRPPNWSAAMALVIAAVVIYGIAHAFGSPSRQVNAAAHRKTVPVPMPRLPAGPPPRPRRASSTGPCWSSSQRPRAAGSACTRHTAP